MIKKDDMKVVKLTADEITTVDLLANRRIIFEYPRGNYGDYDKRSEKGNKEIRNGLLGEFAFFNLAYHHICGKYSKIKADERWKLLRGKFSYSIVLGKPDSGFEFEINGKSIDIKNYGTKILCFDEIYDKPYNLMIDERQKTGADIYVQTFNLSDNEVCIAGYHIGLPPLAEWMQNHAYTIPVPKLSPIAELLECL